MSLSSISASVHTSTRADHLVAAVVDLHRRLQQCPDLRPSAEVNALFEDLVRLVVAAPYDVAAVALRDARVRAVTTSLRALCAAGETELERHWSGHIASHSRPTEVLTRFPYLANYHQLGRIELGVLASTMRQPVASAAFIGCGPLPLTALMLADELGCKVDIVDRDADALESAEHLIGTLGARGIRCRLSAAEDFDASRYDLAVVAAMVGTSADDKVHIFKHLGSSMAPGTTLLARSARGLRTLLYPAIPSDQPAGFDVLGVIHPVNDVINSVIVAQARA